MTVAAAVVVVYAFVCMCVCACEGVLLLLLLFFFFPKLPLLREWCGVAVNSAHGGVVGGEGGGRGWLGVV